MSDPKPEVRFVEGGCVSAESYPDAGQPDWEAESRRLRAQNAYLMQKLDDDAGRCHHCGNTTMTGEEARELVRLRVTLDALRFQFRSTAENVRFPVGAGPELQREYFEGYAAGMRDAADVVDERLQKSRVEPLAAPSFNERTSDHGEVATPPSVASRCVCVHAPEEHGDHGCAICALKSKPCPWTGKCVEHGINVAWHNCKPRDVSLSPWGGFAKCRSCDSVLTTDEAERGEHCLSCQQVVE